MKNLIKLLGAIIAIVSSLVFSESKSYAVSVSYEYEMIMLEKINEYREENGLLPLEYDDDLVRVAEVRIKELPISFEHTRPDGESYKTVYRELDLTSKYNRGSENIAMGHWGNFTTKEECVEYVFEAYKNSESHRLNMLKPYWKHYGGSIAVSQDSESYQIQVFAD